MFATVPAAFAVFPRIAFALFASFVVRFRKVFGSKTLPAVARFRFSGGVRAPVLHITGLTVHRGKTRILDGLDWTVGRGEHWVILGANGSGKTSLLSALTGYFTPTDGTLDLLGQRYGESDWRELRRHVGIVSSAIRQKVPDWDSAELVVIGGKYAMLDYWGKVTKSDRAAALRELRRVGLAHLADREWGVLSQGERQRVLIARAMMASPTLLILDEPCAGLDPVAREKFLAFVQKLAAQKSGPTLLFVTHHVEEIMPAFTHALLLKRGKVAEADTIARALTSKSLSEIFGEKLKLKRGGTRYQLSAV